MSISFKVRQNHKTIFFVQNNGEIYFRNYLLAPIKLIFSKNLINSIRQLYFDCVEFVEENREFLEKYSSVWVDNYRIVFNNTTSISISSKFPINLDFLHKRICLFTSIDESSIEKGNFSLYEDLLDKTIFEKKLRLANIRVGENAVILDNNKYWIKAYDGLLNFIVDTNNIDNYKYQADNELFHSINTIWTSVPSFLYGNFSTSDVNKNKIFSPCDKSLANHVLVKTSSKKEPEIMDYLYKFSFGDSFYFVINLNHKNNYKEEDI